jgi:hypothetical protein
MLRKRFFEKPPHHFKKIAIPLKMYLKSHAISKTLILTLIKKASISLEMFSNRIEIFKKASNHFIKSLNFLLRIRILKFFENILKMPRIFYSLKNSDFSEKVLNSLVLFVNASHFTLIIKSLQFSEIVLKKPPFFFT